MRKARHACASDKMPTTPRLIRRSRIGLFLFGVLCRVALLATLSVPQERRFRATILLVLVGMLPYLLGGLLVGRVRSVIQLATVVGLVTICDALATAGALFPGSSTDPVGLIMEPIIVSTILLLVLAFTRKLDPAH
jgi:hypothetical protein